MHNDEFFQFVLAFLLIIATLTGCRGEETIYIKVESDGAVYTLPLEKYTAGVVLAEIGCNAPLNALKAQAVAARSYALYKKDICDSGENTHSSGSHVCTDSGHCQAYMDCTDNLNVIKAVNETAGQVLTYEGKIAHTLYHDSSPNMTESIQNVWDCKAIPYLQGVKNYLKEGYEPVVTEFEFTPEEFGMTSIKIGLLNTTDTGRLGTLSINGVLVSAVKIRDIFGLTSTAIYAEAVGGNVLHVTCMGRGHGVGMSQRGAIVMAEKGYSYSDILAHYYTGTEIGRYINGK